MSEYVTVTLIRFCMSCGTELGLIAPCQCRNCGQEYWRNIKPCGGACVVNNGKLLMVLRADDPGAGLWDLPGGFCDPAEHPLATAHREVQEETGLTLHSMRFLGMWIDTYGNEDPPEVTLNIYYLGQAERPELARISDETAEVRWFRPEDLPVDTLAFAHVEQAIRCWSEVRDDEQT
jgi:8-oxo-dGTP diphosphatase